MFLEKKTVEKENYKQTKKNQQQTNTCCSLKEYFYGINILQLAKVLVIGKDKKAHSDVTRSAIDNIHAQVKTC